MLVCIYAYTVMMAGWAGSQAPKKHFSRNTRLRPGKVISIHKFYKLIKRATFQNIYTCWLL